MASFTLKKLTSGVAAIFSLAAVAFSCSASSDEHPFSIRDGKPDSSADVQVNDPDTETLPPCTAAQAGIDAINARMTSDKLAVHSIGDDDSGGPNEFIVTNDIGTSAVSAVDKATGAWRDVAKPTFIPSTVIPTKNTLFLSQYEGLWRIARSPATSNTSPELVRILPQATALLTDGEYIYGSDSRQKIDNGDGNPHWSTFRAKISDLETLTTETAATSPLIEIILPDDTAPFLANKEALYVRGRFGQQGPIQVSRLSWGAGRDKPISQNSVDHAAITSDSIFFIDSVVDGSTSSSGSTGTTGSGGGKIGPTDALRQKVHGTSITLTVVADHVQQGAIVANDTHLYFAGVSRHSSQTMLNRVSVSGGEVKTIAGASGKWFGQDSKCVYALGTKLVGFAK